MKYSFLKGGRRLCGASVRQEGAFVDREGVGFCRELVTS